MHVVECEPQISQPETLQPTFKPPVKLISTEKKRRYVVCGESRRGSSEGDVHVIEREPVVIHVLEPEVDDWSPSCLVFGGVGEA